MIDDDEPTIIHSPLSQRIEGDGTFIDVEIYRGEDDDGWLLEIVDEENASTVYHAPFPSDQAALDEVLRVIATDGIRAFVDGEVDDDDDGSSGDHSGTVH